jgi:hypothetical protein
MLQTLGGSGTIEIKPHSTHLVLHQSLAAELAARVKMHRNSAETERCSGVVMVCCGCTLSVRWSLKQAHIQQTCSNFTPSKQLLFPAMKRTTALLACFPLWTAQRACFVGSPLKHIVRGHVEAFPSNAGTTFPLQLPNATYCCCCYRRKAVCCAGRAA